MIIDIDFHVQYELRSIMLSNNLNFLNFAYFLIEIKITYFNVLIRTLHIILELN